MDIAPEELWEDSTHSATENRLFGVKNGTGWDSLGLCPCNPATQRSSLFMNSNIDVKSKGRNSERKDANLCTWCLKVSTNSACLLFPPTQERWGLRAGTIVLGSVSSQTKVSPVLYEMPLPASLELCPYLDGVHS